MERRQSEVVWKVEPKGKEEEKWRGDRDLGSRLRRLTAKNDVFAFAKCSIVRPRADRKTGCRSGRGNDTTLAN